MVTKVVNIYKEKYDVYGGRPKDNSKYHWGNPFTHKAGTKAKTIFPTRQEAINAFSQWIRGEQYQEIEPDRRQWMLDNIDLLLGKIIGCFCAPQECHLCILLDLIEEKHGGKRLNRFTLIIEKNDAA